MKMLVTDLDNTLYDWVSFFSASFRAMVDELAVIIEEDENTILDEFRQVHQQYNNIETPFSIAELPCVKKHFGDLCKTDLLKALNRPLHAFNSVRKRELHLYDHVEEVLAILHANGFVIVAYTEAIAANAYYRLNKLGIDQYFHSLYSLDSDYPGHPDPEREKQLQAPAGFIRKVPHNEKKPNPALLLDICKREGIRPEDTWYLGDSLRKDVMTTKGTGVKSIWAQYGTLFDPTCLKIIDRVTHWSDEEISHERSYYEGSQEVKPDYTINNFLDLLTVFDISQNGF